MVNMADQLGCGTGRRKEMVVIVSIFSGAGVKGVRLTGRNRVHKESSRIRGLAHSGHSGV